MCILIGKGVHSYYTITFVRQYDQQFNERVFKIKIGQYMYIDILRVHNDWRENKSSLDLRGVVQAKENRCVNMSVSL